MIRHLVCTCVQKRWPRKISELTSFTIYSDAQGQKECVLVLGP